MNDEHKRIAEWARELVSRMEAMDPALDELTPSDALRLAIELLWAVEMVDAMDERIRSLEAQQP
jgi:hypothetical protein